MSEFSELVGKTLTEIEGMEKGEDQITFITADNLKYFMSHDQSCCESVSVEDIHGEIDEILNSPITHAEVVTNSEENPVDADKELTEYQDSFTWTYYFLRTDKGSLTIRWYGESNGYYGEEVDFYKEGTNSWD